MRWYLVPVLIGAACLATQIFILNWWPASSYLVNVPVIFIIITTLQRGVRYGLIMAAMTGLVLMSVSAIHGLSYPVALVTTVGITWLSTTKIFTTRSSASFVTTIAIASFMYGIVLIGTEALQGVFDHDRLHVKYGVVLVAAITTSVTHPIGISSIWRWMRWDRYEHVSSQQKYG